ncbi:preprotein translocase subunit SecE [bacterium]|nr:preprotein translocase subunit SecE [bacterium]MDY3862270.1 preprotein translocase subunit SecE [Ruminococcus sp.]
MAAKNLETKTDKKAAKKNKKPNVFSRAVKYLRECKGEIKKITWPTPLQTTKNFGIVLLVIFVIGLFVYALDTGLFSLLSLVMSMYST